MRSPKHDIICWLAMYRRLLTKDRMQRLEITQDTDCMLCGVSNESIEHLFFECTFSRLYLRKCFDVAWDGHRSDKLVGRVGYGSGQNG